MKIIYKTIFRIKIALGVLVLMLRTNAKAVAQEDEGIVLCYVIVVPEPKNIVTVKMQSGINKLNANQFSIEYSRAFYNRIYKLNGGLHLDYQNSNIYCGPLFHLESPNLFYLYPFYRWTMSVSTYFESSAQVSLSKTLHNNVSVSYGFVIEQQNAFDISIFSGIQTDNTLSSGYYHTWGISVRHKFRRIRHRREPKMSG